MTQWRTIPGYERYQISDDGQIRSFTPWGRGRVLKPAIIPSGRLKVSLSPTGDDRRQLAVHRLVALAFIGPAPEGRPDVLHGDGDPTNNHVSNLRWGNASENQADSIRHGTHAESRKTHCDRGHVFDEANTRVEPNGNGPGRQRRQCRRCDALKAKARRDRLRREKARLAVVR